MLDFGLLQMLFEMCSAEDFNRMVFHKLRKKCYIVQEYSNVLGGNEFTIDCIYFLNQF